MVFKVIFQYAEDLNYFEMGARRGMGVKSDLFTCYLLVLTRLSAAGIWLDHLTTFPYIIIFFFLIFQDHVSALKKFANLHVNQNLFNLTNERPALCPPLSIQGYKVEIFKI